MIRRHKEMDEPKFTISTVDEAKKFISSAKVYRLSLSVMRAGVKKQLDSKAEKVSDERRYLQRLFYKETGELENIISTVLRIGVELPDNTLVESANAIYNKADDISILAVVYQNYVTAEDIVNASKTTMKNDIDKMNAMTSNPENIDKMYQ
jgi:hypothetical protein